MKNVNLVLAAVVLAALTNLGHAAKKDKGGADAQAKESAAIFDGAKDAKGAAGDAVQVPQAGATAAAEAKIDVSQPSAGSGNLDSIRQYMNERSGIYQKKAREERKKTIVGVIVMGGASAAWNVANNLVTSALPLIGYAFGALGFGLLGLQVYKAVKGWKDAKKSTKVLTGAKVGLLAAAGIAAVLAPVTLGLLGLVATALYGVGYALKHDRVANDASNRAQVLKEEAEIAGA